MLQDGSEYVLDSEFEYWQKCSCLESKKLNRLILTSEITPEFTKKSFENFYVESAAKEIVDMQRLCVDYYDSFNEINNIEQNSIALLGQPGSGKTHLLTALCNSMMNRKMKKVFYFPYIEGFDNLRSDFEKLENKLNLMKHVDILFFDDLFKPVTKSTKEGRRAVVPQASEWEIKQLYSVINYRYMNHKPIFISSELLFNEIIYLDEALGSRIYQMCRNYFIEIEKNVKLNYRLKK